MKTIKVSFSVNGEKATLQVKPYETLLETLRERLDLIGSKEACGMGACLGCAVAGADPAAPYLHVCKDGPVFDAAALDWS